MPDPRRVHFSSLCSRRSLVSLLALVLAIVLTACSGPTRSVEPLPMGGDAGPGTSTIALEGTEWMLISLNGTSLIEGSNITLNFTEGRIQGFAGCNAYGSDYSALDDGTLTIPETLFEITMQACQMPTGVMEQEEAYVKALQNATIYRVMGDRLEIENDAGQTTLVFVRKAQFLMDPTDLVGTEWRLVSLAGSKLIEGSAITLAFHNDHMASGHAGCRDYVFAYRASGDDIRFPFQSMIGDPCLDDEALMRQEGQYTTLFGWATDYRLSEGQLEIFTARGEVLVYEPLPDDADADFEGTLWRLQAFIEEKTVEGMEVPLPRVTELLRGTEITMTFKDGVVSGSAGCNRHAGSYKQNGSRLTIGELAWEEKTCATPAGVMGQEQRYLDFLAHVTSHRIIGRQLWLGTEYGSALIFTALE